MSGNTSGTAVTGLAGPYLRQYSPEGPVQLRSVETASVLFYPDGRQFELWPSGWRNGRPPRMRRPYAVVEVALGQHRTDFPMALPAAGGAAFFQAGVDVVWAVADPVKVATAQLRDITVPLRPELEERLRDITLRFPITQAARANEAIRAELGRSGSPPIGSEVGLTTRVYVRLDLDDAAIRAANELRNDDSEAELFARRTARMQRLLAAGDYSQAAAIAAKNPNDLAAAISMLKDENRANQRQTIDFVKYMIDAGLLEPQQLDRQTQAILNWVEQAVDPLLPVASDVPQLPPSGGGRDQSFPRLTALRSTGRGDDKELVRRRSPGHPAARTRTAWDEDDVEDQPQPGQQLRPRSTRTDRSDQAWGADREGWGEPPRDEPASDGWDEPPRNEPPQYDPAPVGQPADWAVSRDDWRLEDWDDRSGSADLWDDTGPPGQWADAGRTDAAPRVSSRRVDQEVDADDAEDGGGSQRGRWSDAWSDWGQG